VSPLLAPWSITVDADHDSESSRYLPLWPGENPGRLKVSSHLGGTCAGKQLIGGSVLSSPRSHSATHLRLEWLPLRLDRLGDLYAARALAKVVKRSGDLPMSDFDGRH
jgi:hypothetical protein